MLICIRPSNIFLKPWLSVIKMRREIRSKLTRTECHYSVLTHALTTNHRMILTYLIPCHLLTSHTLPTEKLLEPYPRLQKLFLPLTRCIKKGDLHAFDQALKEGEDEFIKRRIYLTLERGHDTCLRNLLRKVFIAGGFEEQKEPGAPLVRRTRIPLDDFIAALSLGSQQRLDADEVECQLANMIYKVSRCFVLWLSSGMPCLPCGITRNQAALR